MNLSASEIFLSIILLAIAIASMEFAVYLNIRFGGEDFKSTEEDLESGIRITHMDYTNDVSDIEVALLAYNGKALAIDNVASMDDVDENDNLEIIEEKDINGMKTVIARFDKYSTSAYKSDIQAYFEHLRSASHLSSMWNGDSC